MQDPVPEMKLIDRRSFLELSLLSSVALWLSRGASAATDTLNSPPARFSSLDDLPATAITPNGWLRTYLEKQAEQLGYHLPDVSGMT